MEVEVAVEVLFEGRLRTWARRRILLEESVENDLVAVLVGVDPVKNKSGLGLEPADLLARSTARNDAYTRIRSRPQDSYLRLHGLA